MATTDPETAPGESARARRRPWWLVAVALVVVVAAVVTAIALGALSGSDRPALVDGERYGVDVSHHQGPIDWVRVSHDDIAFAYIKASEGVDFTDPRFRANWTGAGAAGIPHGAYHFFTLCAPGAAQAAHFLDVLPDDPNMLPPAVDLETANNCDARPDPDVVRRELGAFVRIVEARTGMQVVLYVNHRLALRLDAAGALPARPRWTRSIDQRPPAGWAIWQASGSAEVDGIDTPVDLDVADAAWANRWGL
ncbi:MAG TPA: GH25 family lysozyme [Actinomycetota bacterium]|nr:GH25 family lysozyme [Actinomycetota bacterium]